MSTLGSGSWTSARNAAGFRLRRALRWSLGPPRLRQEPKGRLFSYLEDPRAADARERELRERYALEPLRECSRRIDYQENLYLLDLLEGALPGQRFVPGTRALDVGSKNWSYVFALQRFLAARGAEPLELHGVEVDAHVVYWTLRSRKDLAQAYMAQTGNEALRFWSADVRELEQGEFDLVTWFYPFLTREALLGWGLPLSLLEPRGTLQAVVDRVRPGGHLLLVTHTLRELGLLIELEPPGLELVRRGPVQSQLVPYWPRTQERTASLYRRG